MFGITRLRLVIGAAVAFLLILTSLLSHRPPNADFLFVSSDDLRTQTAQPLAVLQDSNPVGSKEVSLASVL
jgi:hypothetical protein